jgi:hypothetical protein
MSERITINYRALGLDVVLKIVELANLLQVPPAKAAEIYLFEAASQNLQGKEAA